MYDYYGSRSSRDFSISSTVTPISHRESKIIDEYQAYRARLAREKLKPPEYKCFDWKYVKAAVIVLIVLIILAGIATGIAYVTIKDTIGYNSPCFDYTSCKSALELDCINLKCLCKTNYTWSGTTCKVALNSG